ncbi:MAG TPA: hypothetical protein VD963_03785, partial [Phycisphaerales bacterium]|nr:hypothetical protein [Phycisphaerales bacterium]
MSAWWVQVLVALAGWLLVAIASARLLRNPRGDVETGLVLWGIRVYAGLLHSLRIRGGRHIPPSRRPGPLIVVANHTAGVDPLLIQSACPFEVRWM